MNQSNIPNRVTCARCGYPAEAGVSAATPCIVCGATSSEGTPLPIIRLGGRSRMPFLVGGTGLIVLCCVGLVALALLPPTPTNRATGSSVVTNTAQAIALAQTEAANPTATLPPTQTSLPTNTLLPTNTPLPTDTLGPTHTPLPPTPTPKPSQTPKPTATPKPTQLPATPTPVPTEAPFVLRGQGQQASAKFALQSGLAIFRMTHAGARNFAINLLDSSGNSVDLLVNTIGSFNGSKVESIPADGSYLLDITADGAWTVSITQPQVTSAPGAPQTLKGHGQQASTFFSLSSGLAIFKMTHNGQRNFAIILYSAEGDYIDLLANTIGPFDGSKPEKIPNDGIYLLDITADGDWSVSITQEQ